MAYQKSNNIGMFAMIIYSVLHICSQQLPVIGENMSEVIQCTTEMDNSIELVCHFECQSDCTCALDNHTLISYCTDGGVFVTQVHK